MSDAASSPRTWTPSAAKAAPKPASWVYAEDLLGERELDSTARTAATPLGVSSIGRGGANTLTFLARAIGAKAVVEIGTGSGVSGLALFAGMAADGILTSVDVEPEHQQVARRAFTELGIPARRFRLIAGTALSVLPKLSSGAYDLVFVDGDQAEYPEYVEQALRLLRHGGVMAIDNALNHDRTADSGATDDETTAVRAAVAAVVENEDLTASLLPVGDGLLVAVKG